MDDLDRNGNPYEFDDEEEDDDDEGKKWLFNIKV